MTVEPADRSLSGWIPPSAQPEKDAAPQAGTGSVAVLPDEESLQTLWNTVRHSLDDPLLPRPAANAKARSNRVSGGPRSTYRPAGATFGPANGKERSRRPGDRSHRLFRPPDGQAAGASRPPGNPGPHSSSQAQDRPPSTADFGSARSRLEDGMRAESGTRFRIVKPAMDHAGNSDGDGDSGNRSDSQDGPFGTTPGQLPPNSPFAAAGGSGNARRVQGADAGSASAGRVFGCAALNDPSNVQPASPAVSTLNMQQLLKGLVSTLHTIVVDGRTLSYRVSCGMIPLYDLDGSVTAEVFVKAVTLEGVDPAERKLTVCLGGGPGASSVYPDMGLAGPKLVVPSDRGFVEGAPYCVVDNPHTWLPETDMLVIDPINTGYSRMMPGQPKERYNSFTQDARYLSLIVARYLAANKRSRSPVVISGSSYGGLRALGMVEQLGNMGLTPDGIMLNVPALHYQAVRFDPGNDLPHALYLPTYAATAYHHGKLEPRQQARPLTELLEEVDTFVDDRFLAALFKGNRLTDGERNRVIEALAGYTGLKPDIIRQADLRIGWEVLASELMRAQGLLISSIDSRFSTEHQPVGRISVVPPMLQVMADVYGRAVDEYTRGTLGYQPPPGIEYVVVDPTYEKWRWHEDFFHQYAEGVTLLEKLMNRMKHLRVHYTWATNELTNAAAHRWILSRLSAANRERVEARAYPGPHMAYLYQPTLERMSADARRFLRPASPEAGRVRTAPAQTAPQAAKPPAADAPALADLLQSHASAVARLDPAEAQEPQACHEPDRWLDRVSTVHAYPLDAQRRAALRSACEASLRDAARLALGPLAEPERVQLDLFVWDLQRRLALMNHDEHLRPLPAWQESMPGRFSQWVSGQAGSAFQTMEAYEAFGQWAPSLRVWVDAAIQNMRVGMARGRSQPRQLIEEAITEIDQLVSEDPELNPLYWPAGKLKDRFTPNERRRCTAIVDEHLPRILQAYRDLGQFLRDEYLPACCEQVGTRVLLSGPARYHDLVKLHTGTDVDLDEAHRLGWQKIADLHERMQQLQKQLGLSGNLHAAAFSALAHTDVGMGDVTGSKLEQRLAYQARAVQLDHPEWFSQPDLRPGHAAFDAGWNRYVRGLVPALETEEPLDRFVNLIQELRVAVRGVIDGGLHLRGWHGRQAAAIYAQHAFGSEPYARSDIHDIIARPGRALVPIVGEAVFKQLRTDCGSALQDRFDLRAFHDEIVKDGSLPPSVLQRKMARWQAGLGDA
jgi:uncharacterized protein (DUF885 family)/carboxypeptidase C (cathepsin A)